MRELHTERLLLRTPRERDAAEIMAIRNSAFVMKNNVMEVVDKEQMVHLIHREIDYENTWYIERKEDGRFAWYDCGGGGRRSVRCALEMSFVLSRGAIYAAGLYERSTAGCAA